jgi:probable rRNA maturation factor
LGIELDLGVIVADDRWEAELNDADILAERAAVAALMGARETLPPAGLTRGFELTVMLSDDSTVQDLNRTYRGKDTPTNVLSFALTEGEAGPGYFVDPEDDDEDACALGPVMLGDVVLAWETVVREAREQHKALADHAVHLIVHGVLHLLGWDHLDDVSADAMEGRETQILAGLGIGSPYATTPVSDNDQSEDDDDRRTP